MNEPDISSVISQEEVTQFYDLLQKMNKAHAMMDQYSIENMEAQKAKPDGEIPYQIVIHVVFDVYQEANGLTVAPEIVENNRKTYVIDVITDDYNKILEELTTEITNKLSEKCSTIIPVPKPEG